MGSFRDQEQHNRGKQRLLCVLHGVTPAQSNICFVWFVARFTGDGCAEDHYYRQIEALTTMTVVLQVFSKDNRSEFLPRPHSNRLIGLVAK